MAGTSEAPEEAGGGPGASSAVGSFGIRLMTDADVEAVAAGQARAFHDDPLHAWAVPDADLRLDLLNRMLALQTRVSSVPLGASYTDATRSVGCYWCPPGRWLPTPEERAALAPMREILGESAARFAVALRAMKAVHPGEPHWYLQGLGTDPARQGLGLGAAALAPVLVRCDAEGLPAYLESTKERNIGFYERFGFRLRGELSIPEGGPTLWPMWREPRPAPTDGRHLPGDGTLTPDMSC